MAVETCIGVGDLYAARRWGRQMRDLPLLAEVGHLATSRLLVVAALAGDVEDTVADSDRFLDSWTHSGRPRAPSLDTTAAAVAMVHGLRGDDGARAEWLAVVDELGVPPERKAGYGPTFDAIVLLHRGQATLALERIAAEPDEPTPSKWITWIWLHWYVALRAEAAVLAADPHARSQLEPPALSSPATPSPPPSSNEPTPCSARIASNSSRPRPHSMPLVVRTRPPEP
jgi:hypothetical protein